MEVPIDNHLVDWPDDLISNLASEKCILFAGSGVSAHAGLPTWAKLLEKLIEGYHSASGRRDLDHLVQQNDFLTVGQELRDELRPEQLRASLQSIIGSADVRPAEIHDALASLPFAAALTTNYDKLLEACYTLKLHSQPKTITSLQISQMGNYQAENTFFIYKAHGTIDDMNSIILGRNDYRKIMANAANLEFLKRTFSSKTILFLGFGLADMHINCILDALDSAFQGYTTLHYAVFPDGKISDIQKKRFLKDYGLQILTYKASDSRHLELVWSLRSLYQAFIKSKEPLAGGHGRAEKRVVIESVLGHIADSQHIPSGDIENLKRLLLSPHNGSKKSDDKEVMKIFSAIESYNAIPNSFGSAGIRHSQVQKSGLVDLLQAIIGTSD